MGTAALIGDLTVTSPDGTTVSSKSKTVVRLVRRPGRLTMKLDGTRGALAIQGAISSTLSSAAGARGAGIVVLAAGAGKSLTLRATGATARTIGAPSNASVRVSVARSKGFAACPVGTSGMLKVTDSDAQTRAGKTRDRLTLMLPAECGGSRSFVAAASGGGLSLRLGFR